jgi:hypothetical protein
MLLHQRHYAMVLRLDRRDRFDISELAAHHGGLAGPPPGRLSAALAG